MKWSGLVKRDILDFLERVYEKGGSLAILTFLNKENSVRKGVSVLDGRLEGGYGDIDVYEFDSGWLGGDDIGGSDVVGLAQEQEVIIEVMRPERRLIVFGAGHVGKAVAELGLFAGFKVLVVDDRGDFLEIVRNVDSEISVLCVDYNESIQDIGIDESCSVVIVTRGHQFDEICLSEVLNSTASYIGMIGSRRRVKAVFQRLTDRGCSERELVRVHAPIGLDIGASSPEEIAVAILAEVIQTLNR